MPSNYRILAHIGLADSCAYYRTLTPVINCRDELAKSHITLECSSNMSHPDYDCYIFNRIPDPKSFIIINMLYSMGKKIVWDLDDELWNVSPSNKLAYEHYDATMNHFLGLYLQMSSAISVSTNPLKESVINKFGDKVLKGKKISVLENLIDTKDYEPFIQEKVRGNRVKIMWSGSESHVEDLDPVVHLFNLYKDRKDVIFIFHGHMPGEIRKEKPDRVTLIPFHPRKYYEGVISILSPDIALIPLKSNQFNICKSAIKYFEMTMAGAACICSNMSPYLDVNNRGELSDLCECIEEWEFSCDGLIDNRDDSEYMQRRAKDSIIGSYSWNTNNKLKQNWIEFFRELAG